MDDTFGSLANAIPLHLHFRGCLVFRPAAPWLIQEFADSVYHLSHRPCPESLHQPFVSVSPVSSLILMGTYHSAAVL